MITTCIRKRSKDDKVIRQEKLVTLKEYVEMGRLEPGQLVYVCEVDFEKNTHTNSETLIVGNCMPSIQPTTSDCGVGWDLAAPIMKKYVLEVHLF